MTCCCSASGRWIRHTGRFQYSDIPRFSRGSAATRSRLLKRHKWNTSCTAPLALAVGGFHRPVSVSELQSRRHRIDELYPILTELDGSSSVKARLS